MKKLLLSAVIIMAIGFTATAQDAPMKEKKTTKKEKKAALKNHVCTDACHKSGKCVMTHGEKGHKCGESCKKAA